MTQPQDKGLLSLTELPAYKHLKEHQTQIDGEGIAVAVSRQALDELFAAIECTPTPPLSLSEDITSLLTPIADQNWHGKWRIQKVLEMLAAQSNTTPLNGGTTQYAGASAPVEHCRTSRDGLGDSCERGVLSANKPEGDAPQPEDAHAKDCEWHTDQSDWDCTCGAYKGGRHD